MESLSDLNRVFNDLRVRAINARLYIDNSLEKLQKLRDIRFDLRDAEDSVRRIISELDARDQETSLVDGKFTSLKDEAIELLLSNLKDAADLSDEFGREPYLSRLIEACSEPDIITITRTGVGWDSKITVAINLDESAGSLDEWGMAVTEVRETNGWGIDKNGGSVDPRKSSGFWRRKVYPDIFGSWIDTVEQRLDFVSGKAPFWRLLNYGSMQTLSSDKGGTAFPRVRPTLFVEKTEEGVEASFARFVERAKLDSIAYRNGIFKLANEMSAYEDFLNEDITKLRADVDFSVPAFFYQPSPPPPPKEEMVDFDAIYNSILDKRESVIQKMAEKLGKPELAGNKKFASVIIDLLEYQGNVINFRVTKDNRIEITEKGGPRTRVSVKKLKSLFIG